MRRITIGLLTVAIALSAVGCRVSVDEQHETTTTQQTNQTTTEATGTVSKKPTVGSTVSRTASSTAATVTDRTTGQTTATTKATTKATTTTVKPTSSTTEWEDEVWEDEQTLQIDSLDKLNFYAVKEALAAYYEAGGSSRTSAFSMMSNRVKVAPVGLMAHTGNSISPNATFTITMYSYFTVTLGEQMGFLAQKLGGTGAIEVVITRNDFNNMITFKKGERYYSCFQTAQSENAMTFSTRKYVSGFRLIENDNQENYEYTVYFDGDKVLGMNCGQLAGNGTFKYVEDTIEFNDNFCFVIHKTEQFTAEQLEALFAFNRSFRDDGILLQDGSILFGESTMADHRIEFKNSAGTTIVDNDDIQKVQAMYHPTYRFCVRLEFAPWGDMSACKATTNLFIDQKQDRTVTLQRDPQAVYVIGLGNKSRMSDVFYKLTATDTDRRIGKIVDFKSFVQQVSKRLNLKEYDMVQEESDTAEQTAIGIYGFELKTDRTVAYKASNYDVVIDGTTLTLPMKVSKLFSLGFTLEKQGFNEDIGQGFVSFLSPRGNRVDCYVMDYYGTAKGFSDCYITQLNVYCYEKKAVYREGISPTRPDFEMLEGINKDSLLDDIITRLGEPNRILVHTTENVQSSYKTAEIRLMYSIRTASLPNAFLVFNISPVLNGRVPSDYLTSATITLM